MLLWRRKERYLYPYFLLTATFQNTIPVRLITTKLLDFVHRPDFYKPENNRLWKGKLLVFL
jgi:hypothetical protein